MQFPTIYLENNFGEKTENAILGGSSQTYCNFIVDSSNGNGLGIRSLKGLGVNAVFMHTSSTPATGNPNPAVGYILVQLSQPFVGGVKLSQYINGFSGFASPVSGTPINVTTGVTAGGAYVITSLGTTTIDQWQKLGLPVNTTPAVEVAFVAIATTTATGTGVIEVPLTTGSGIEMIDIVGDPNAGMVTSDGSGPWILCRCLAATNSSTTTLVAAAPAAGTVIGLTFNVA